MRYVVVGCSAAGLHAAAAIREVDPDGDLTLLTREPDGHYSRPMLTWFLAGQRSEEDLLFAGAGHLERLGARLLTGHRVVRIDPDARELHCADGTTLSWDRLLLANGGVPRQPDVPGLDLAGVFHLRTLADAQGLREWAAHTDTCVSLGGGLVSIKAAEALRARGVREVVLVIGSDRVMSQALDAGGAARGRRRLGAPGVRVRTGASAAARLPAPPAPARVGAVELACGERLPAQAVLIGKGVSPDLSLCAGAGIDTDWGVLVDERMRTSVPDVWAAGDLAQAADLVHGERRTNALWPLAAGQGRVAGSNMAGRPATYPGWFSMNSLVVFGLPVVSMGLVKPGDVGEAREETFSHPAREVYRRLVLRDGRLLGAVVVGGSDSSGLAGLIRDGREVARPAELARDPRALEVAP